MAKHEFNIKRVAFGNFTIPANTAANTASTLSADCGVYIPKGAIVTGIRYFALGAITNVSAFKNATINPSVAAQVLGTNNLVASAALIATNCVSQVVVTNAGVYVSVGGPLIVNLASSDGDRSAIAGTADIYVEYLYCSDRDLT
jgi:hypothetical protein